MATYILLSTLTDDGAETLAKNPERITAVNQEVEAMGVRVLQQYAVLGPFDFVSIVEAPDNQTVAHMSIHLSQRGSIRIQTLAAIPVEQFIAGLKR